MGKVHSFRDVIQEQFFNEIYQELGVFIETNPSQLESSSNFVLEPDEASLEDFEVKWVKIMSSPDNYLYFDVIVSAEIQIAETIKRNRETDGLIQWFRISCTSILEIALQEMVVSLTLAALLIGKTLKKRKLLSKRKKQLKFFKVGKNYKKMK